jgi:CO dehydrogenase maturation factor
MKIAVAGKGGSGKTTIAGTLARTLGRDGHTVVAIDADPNPNLALSLGLDPVVAAGVEAVPHTFAFHSQDENGQYSVGLSKSPEEIIAEYGINGPDGVTLLMVGRVEAHQAGAG